MKVAAPPRELFSREKIGQTWKRAMAKLESSWR